MRWKSRGCKGKGLKVEGIEQIKTNYRRIFGAGLGNFGSSLLNAGIRREASDVQVKPVLRNGFRGAEDSANGIRRAASDVPGKAGPAERLRGRGIYFAKNAL
jgi:hypothetical protein